MTRFEVTTAIAAPPHRVFDISLEVEVHTASMAGSSEQAIDGVLTGGMKLGDTVTWRAKHFGLYWRMTSLISAYDPPGYFVDEQLKGPFKHWHHVHHFDPDADGATIMRDIIDFTAPFGPAGTIAERTVLNWHMPRLIHARNAHVKAVAESAR
ncbi:ligand-binding SRPBCC domain-containing protein [Kibdelosporangium banguiense]|uniref:Ligand-binding SRPBCC domain-containing protein n=1 Tax=Kibdelosporangium banguiense TaxID=1365924 RepID=A0ABS4TNM3_9PSEU|nr:SRPBCC family protein [Kibdelosporangium banguiense]MBP2326007.1 ligand-binding SRPBCC domain-containing protein [Kibdelosporangium banguiense]